MSTYNCDVYINEAIDSILNQSFVEFDLYIYDDCSTDDTVQIIQKYSDNRIFYIQNKTNLGIAKTLNLGLTKLLPNYEYIARMDADDFSFPERFQKQIDFMEQNLNQAMCGTQGFWLKDLTQNPASGWTYPTENEYLKVYLLFGASFGHSSIMLRTNIFLDAKLRYNETIKTCEDWDLWIRISEKFAVANLPDFLMKYRIVASSNHRSEDNKNKHLQERSKIIANYWKNFNVILSPEQVFEFYYQKHNSIQKKFYPKLKTLIVIFNNLVNNHSYKLNTDDNKDFKYMLARKILDFWKRSNHSRFNLSIWFIIFKNVKFISYFKLFKSQLN